MLRASLFLLLQHSTLCQNHSSDSLQEGFRSASTIGDLSSYIKYSGYQASPESTTCCGTPLKYSSLEQCADYCQAQVNCLAFVADYSNRYKRTCTFYYNWHTSAMTWSGKDMYEKTSPPTPPPAPPPPPPGQKTCSNGWPEFASPAELKSNAWGTYFETVYGQVPGFNYPFCVGDLWFFYDDLITSSGATAPALKGNCPSSTSPEGERYRQNNAYEPSGVSYSWHKPPYAAIPASTWVEVSHQADPFGDEHYGMWFLLAAGNGAWFNTGTTITFDDHAASYSAFGIKSGSNMNEDMCKEGVKRGYDSVQFIKWRDHVNYPCDTAAGASWMNLEIVSVKLTGSYACGASGGAPAEIRGGWKGSIACACDESVGNLNCGVSVGRSRQAVTV